MLHLNPILLGHLPHRLVHIVIHALAPTEELFELAEVEIRVRGQQDETEDEVVAVVAPADAPGEVGVLGEGAAGPVAGDLDAVDGAAEVLVVALDDAHVAADEDQLARPLLLVAQNLLDALAHRLLHLVLPPLLLPLGQPADPRARAAVPALVGPHQRRRREDVRVVDAPGIHDFFECAVVEGHQALPEERVLVPELGRHVDVEAVVDEDELRAPVGQPPDEDVARVRVAVDPAPEEHLGREEVDHRRHDFLEVQPQAAFAVLAFPPAAVRFEVLCT